MSIETDKAGEHLHRLADLFESRNAEYGSSYKQAGLVLARLFPNGVTLIDDGDFNRFCLIVMIIHKLKRYTENFEEGGHEDSSDDLTVYAAMLREMTE